MMITDEGEAVTKEKAKYGRYRQTPLIGPQPIPDDNSEYEEQRDMTRGTHILLFDLGL